MYRATMDAGGFATDVAVKVLREDVDPGGQAVQRLRDEARLLSRITHPAILRVHDLVVLEGRVALVTEFIEGEDLSGLVDGARIGVRALLEVIAAVASGLDAAWSATDPLSGQTLNIVHRDIKPSNIRVSRRGEVKLLDFGIARTDALTREARTQTNAMLGSPSYMAPERFTRSDPMPASDVFGLGCCLFEGLTGARLFADVPFSHMAGLALDRERYQGFIEERSANLPRHTHGGVVDLFRRAVAWDPALRPTAVRLGAEAEQLADDVGGESLLAMVTTRRWRAPVVLSGAWDGMTLTEGSKLVGAHRTQSIGGETGPGSPSDSQETGSRPALLVGLGAVGSLVFTALIVVALVSVWWALQRPGETVELSGEPARLLEPGAATDQPEIAPIHVQESVPLVAEDLPEPALPRTVARNTKPESIRVVSDPEPATLILAPDLDLETEAAPMVRALEPPTALPVRVEPGAQIPALAPPVSVEEPAVDTVHVAIEGGVVTELRDGLRVHTLPADVPPGDWQIWARMGGAFQRVGTLNARPSVAYTVRCSVSFVRCSVEP